MISELPSTTVIRRVPTTDRQRDESAIWSFSNPESLGAPGLREAWLRGALENGFRSLFAHADIDLPKSIRIAAGWPQNSGSGRGRSRVLGQCWGRQASNDGTSEIFISPMLDDAVKVTEVLAHELLHASLNCEGGHGPRFRKLAIAIGLEGPMRSTHAGPELSERLNVLCSELGPYPHARLDPTHVVKKQSTRLIKVVCYRDPNHCYAFWTTRVHLDNGTPTCICGSRMAEVTRRY